MADKFADYFSGLGEKKSILEGMKSQARRIRDNATYLMEISDRRLWVISLAEMENIASDPVYQKLELVKKRGEAEDTEEKAKEIT